MSLVYIASKFSLKEQTIKLYEELHKNGHLVTVNWWDYEGKKVLDSLSEEEFYQDKRVQFLRKRDLFGIDECDIFVLLSTPEPLSFNGANFELGYATAKGKRCCVIGKLDKSAMYCDVEWCPTIAYLLGSIAEQKWTQTNLSTGETIKCKTNP